MSSPYRTSVLNVFRGQERGPYVDTELNEAREHTPGERNARLGERDVPGAQRESRAAVPVLAEDELDEEVEVAEGERGGARRGWEEQDAERVVERDVPVLN